MAGNQNLDFTAKNSSILHEVCINGNVMSYPKCGYCLKLHHSHYQKGVVFDFLTPTGNLVIFLQ